ncbi:hypothetical protein Ate01nite_26920 [Actinoplanes teichomyceticus]|nr:hypothetical protein Ate01nite_26920 [Actinoplanes teichomyceticus]
MDAVATAAAIASLNAGLFATGAETVFWDDDGRPAPWSTYVEVVSTTAVINPASAGAVGLNVVPAPDGGVLRTEVASRQVSSRDLPDPRHAMRPLLVGLVP